MFVEQGQRGGHLVYFLDEIEWQRRSREESGGKRAEKLDHK